MGNASHLKLLRPPPAVAEGAHRASDTATALRRLSPGDLDAAARLAAHHREVAATLPVDSELRALALRAGSHWARLAGLPRRHLAG